MYLNFPISNKNIIFIVGFAGSGKTTLAKSIQLKYNIKYLCHLDDFVYLDNFDILNEKTIIDFFKNKNMIYYQFIKKYPKYIEHILRFNDILKDGPTENEIRPFLIEQIKFIYKLIDFIRIKKYSAIIEGIDLYNVFYHDPRYLTYPIIVKGTSRLKSIFQFIKRDNYKITFDKLKDLFNWTKESEIEINHLLLRYFELYGSKEK